MLSILEWLARYGIIDIIFGLGVVTLIWRLIRKLFPSNYDHLHVTINSGDPVSIQNVSAEYSIVFNIRNTGHTNFYIARAYFHPKQRCFKKLWLGWGTTNLHVRPESDRIADKDNAFELKFQGQQPNCFEDYEALVRPGHSNGITTWLALEEPIVNELIQNRRCGMLYIEYATAGKQGVHVVRV